MPTGNTKPDSEALFEKAANLSLEFLSAKSLKFYDLLRQESARVAGDWLTP